VGKKWEIIMIRLLIGLIIAVSTGLFLLLTALLVVPMVVDQEDYKEQIVELVKEKSGHDIVLYGDISLSLSKFSQITVSFGRSEIKNRLGFSGGSFLLVDSIDIGMDLLPLIGGRYEITSLSATGLDAKLERNNSGLSNWQRAGKVNKNTEASPTKELQKNSPEKVDNKISDVKNSLALLGGFSLGEINIVKARVSYTDHRSSVSYSVENLHINSNAFKPGELSRVEIKGQWQGQNPTSQGNLNLKYSLQFEPLKNEVQVKDLSLEAKGKLPGYPIKESELALNTNLVYDLVDGGLILDNTYFALKAWTHGLAFRELGVNFKGSAVVAPGFATVHLPNSAMTTQIKANTLPPAGIELDIHSDFFFDFASNMAKMQKLRVRGPAGMLVSGNITGKSLQSSPEISGALILDKFEVQTLLNALGRPHSEVGPLSHAAMATKFSITTQKGELEHFTLQLDDTNIKGVASIDSFTKPVVGFDVAVDDLDLDRYLITKNSVKQPINSADDTVAKDTIKVDKTAPVIQEQPSVNPVLLPLAFLDSVNFYGKAVFGRLKVGKVVLRDLLMETTANKGLVTLAPVTAKLYDGRMLANFDLDLKKREPHIKIATQLMGIQAGDLFQDLSGEDKFKGLSNLTLEATSMGVDTGSIRKNLNGTVSLSVEDGELHGFDLVSRIRSIYAAVGNRDKGGVADKELGANITQFSELSASATIKNGVIDNRDLALTSDLLLVNGGGSVDLVAEEVDYTFNADVYTTIKEINQKEAQKIKGLVVPLHLKGKFSNIGPPKIDSGDLSVLLGSALKTKLVQDGLKKLGENEKVRKEIERLEDEFGGKFPVKKLLNDLFGM
jgi:AsmA protein